MKHLPALLLGLLICARAHAAALADDMIVPGERVGPITAESSEASLRAAFGTDRVVPELFWVGEGYACQGSRVLFEAGESLDVAWLDPEKRSGAVSVRVNGRRWKTGDGVGLGLSLKELERINGGPFVLLGFGWDYGGGVVSWRDGRLTGPLPRGGGTPVRIHLGPDREDYADITPEERTQVSGDREVSSAHPVMQRLDPRVKVLTIHFDHGKDCESFFAG